MSAQVGGSAASPTLEDQVRQRSAERREQERLDTRRAILDAATELFARAGADRVSMRQVAAAVGYTATTIYNYFDGRDDLLHHVVLEGFGAFGERLRAAADAHDDPAERYVALGVAYVRFALDLPFHYRLMFIDQPELLGQEPPEGYAPPIESFEVLEEVVVDAVAAGVLPSHVPISTLAMETWTQVHGVASLAVASSYLDDDDALVVQARAGRSMLRGLRAEAAAGPSGAEAAPVVRVPRPAPQDG